MLRDVWDNIIAKSVEFAPRLVAAAIILVLGYILISIIGRALAKFFSKVRFDRSIEIFMENAARVALWIILFIVLLANLGVNVTGLIAGLGIMGIILGFALQDTLGNLASGLFILFNKPFEVGDWIKIGTIVGGVERIGIAACILVSADNVKITIPNKKIWGDIIQNYTGNPGRRKFNIEISVVENFNISEAIKIIRYILKKDERISKVSEPEIIVKSIGEASTLISIRPVVDEEYYWDVQFSLITAIKQEFEKKGIKVSIPQREVWIKTEPKEQSFKLPRRIRLPFNF